MMPQTVAMLHYAGPPMVGGVEITMAAHARVMAADGQHVRIVTGRGAFAYPGVEVLIMPELSSRGPQIDQVARELAQGVVSSTFSALTDAIAGRLARALAGVDVAIVHNVLTLHKNLAFTAALHRLHQAGQAPQMLAWCHDFAWLDPLYIPELHPGYPWDLLRTAWPGVQYVVVSHDRRTLLADLLGLPVEQISVATPGVDLVALLKLEPETVALVDRLDLLRANPLLLLPARITRRKNIEQAIAIVGALRREGWDPRLVITGPPGPHNPTNAAYLAQLQDIRQGTGTSDSVVFLYEVYVDAHGQPLPISDTMQGDLYRLADALLFPSRAEGFGIPILEAGLVGIPIFCSDIAPFRESAGEAALRFDPSAPAEQVAARMTAVLQSDQRTAFRRRVRLEYTWEAIYRRVIVPLMRRSKSDESIQPGDTGTNVRRE